MACRCKVVDQAFGGAEDIPGVGDGVPEETPSGVVLRCPSSFGKGYSVLRKGDVEPLVLRRLGAPAEAGPRALLLHGLGSAESCWNAFAEHRPPGLDLWTAGLPWRAGGPFAVPERDEGDRITEAIARVPGGVDVVIAHSYATLLLLARLADAAVGGADPARELAVRGVVLVSPFFRPRPEDFAWSELPGFLERLRLGAEEGIRVMARKPLDPDLRAEMAEHACAQLGPHWVVRYLHAYLRTPFLRVEQVNLPVHVIVGDRDPIAPPAEGELLAARLGNASIDRIDDCGHTPMAERPERFSLAVRRFLTTLSAGHPPATANRVREHTDGHPDRCRDQEAAERTEFGDDAPLLRGRQHQHRDRFQV
ncbi:alpha/beta fold hydrolase [Streptomyces calidiresistens]|uniref:Alpha/beta fold hydrolase n=1 Tax=Streptomyces calidiresistens TaxID=1485586 RepID=A0A7W3T2I6_9ACTN|nr:alpha/beta fold hydrolase [Streptomyces calidiresistens]